MSFTHNRLASRHLSLFAPPAVMAVPRWEPSGARSDEFFLRLNSGDISGVRQLLLWDRGHVTALDNRGLSALIRAQFLKDSHACHVITKMLINLNAHHNSRDPMTGLDALGWACCLGRAVTVPLLLKHAAIDIDFRRGQDTHGNSYLHLAILSGCRETVCFVADAMKHLGIGVDTPRNHRGLSPFLFALREGEESLAQLLVHRYGAQTHQFDDLLRHDEEGWRQIGSKNRKRRAAAAAHRLWSRHRIAGRMHLAPSNSPPPPLSPPPKTKLSSQLPMSQLLALWAEQKAVSWRPAARPESPVLLCLAEQSRWRSQAKGGRKGKGAARARHSITDPVMPAARRRRSTGDMKRKQSLQIGHLGEQSRPRRSLMGISLPLFSFGE